MVRQEYEEKIKGLMPAELRQELEDTITSLKAQVRADCLPDTGRIQAGLEHKQHTKHTQAGENIKSAPPLFIHNHLTAQLLLVLNIGCLPHTQTFFIMFYKTIRSSPPNLCVSELNQCKQF